MKVIRYGIDTPHAKGEWIERSIFDYYFVGCFQTPFLYEKAGKKEKGNAGDILIVEPGKIVFHGPRKNSEDGFVNDYIYIYGYEFEELLSRYAVPFNTAVSVGNPSFLKKYIEKIAKEQKERAIGYEEKCDFMLSEMVIDLCRECRKNQKIKKHKDRVELARKEFLQRPEKGWSLEEMAKLSGYSPSRFSAIYKEKYGLSPKQDIINMRIQRATQLLKYSNLTVSEIAEESGFQTIYYFSKYFKQNTGMTPTEYTEKNRKKAL